MTFITLYLALLALGLVFVFCAAKLTEDLE